MATTDFSLEQRGGYPASIDAERAVLGAMLLDGFAITQAGSIGLKADHFSLDSHRRIYSAICELTERNVAVDLVTLANELSRKKELEAVGDDPYLFSLTEGLPVRSNIEHHVQIIKDKALLRSLINAANGAIAAAADDSEPAQDILNSLEGQLFELAGGHFNTGFSDVSEIVKSSFGSIDALYERGKAVTGLETHFVDLDALTSGFQKSDLIIIAARPSMGKTAFAMNIAENAATRNKSVCAIFSLEMSKESLLLRMLCSYARVDSHKLRTGFLGREDFGKLQDALSDLADSPLYIDDTPSITVSEMRAKCRRLQHQLGRLDLVVVDYLQLMSGTPAAAGGRKYENRTQEVSAISRGLKMLAKEMKVPVVALSQLSRAPESRTGDHTPQLSDLRESGSIEQDADVVMFLYRPEYYDRDNPDLHGKAKLVVAKQRNGPTDVIQLAFMHSSTRFESLERGDWIK
jgi:replicative DNA helicase